MQFGAVSDIGRVRKINEDSFFVSKNELFPYIIVADGMGGHEAGEVASRMMTDIVENHLRRNLDGEMDYVEAGEAIRQAFVAANSIIYTYAKNHYKVMGMGTTATLAMIFKGKLIAAHVGDSRGYKLYSGHIEQITKDHSYVMELVARGDITMEEAKHHPKKNFITRAIGAEDIVRVDISIFPYEGETVLLCSDGLTNFVEDNEILEYMLNADNLQCGVERLVRLANERGGRDNITAAAMKKE
ncbi:MAG: Stp1/IreP family PP2C-type Ser/Thr phosphatase [Clostridiales bacterium]|nr:Stp1/IreP family PP2C-type Ser/Thr phosphatase [Clostridiales bacterium]